MIVTARQLRGHRLGGLRSSASRASSFTRSRSTCFMLPGVARQRQLARQQVVARVAVGHLHDFAAVPDVLDVVSKNDFHECPLHMSPELEPPCYSVTYGISASWRARLMRRLQLALVRRAGARDAARQDLAALRHERAEQLHVLVVDVVDLVRAELADLAAAEQRAPLLVLLVAAASAAPRAARSMTVLVLLSWLHLRPVESARRRHPRPRAFTGLPLGRQAARDAAALASLPSGACGCARRRGSPRRRGR